MGIKGGNPAASSTLGMIQIPIVFQYNYTDSKNSCRPKEIEPSEKLARATRVGRQSRDLV